MKITRGNPGVFTEELPGHYLDFNHNDITDKIQKEEIVKEVMKHRMVKEGSINLTLSDRNLFDRTEDGKYTLRSE